MSISPEEINKSRKALIWGLPYTIAVLPLFYFFGLIPLMESIRDVIEEAPSARLGSAAILSPVIIILISLAVLCIALKAIPAREIFINHSVRAVNFMGFLSLFMLIIGMPLAWFAQNQLMPKIGYTKCNILQDHPTIWFNDWVRNPAWCVAGKSREWIREQAQKPKNHS